MSPEILVVDIFPPQHQYIENNHYMRQIIVTHAEIYLDNLGLLLLLMLFNYEVRGSNKTQQFL